MNMHQNFSGPEGGVNPYDNNDDRFGKPIESVPVDGIDFEPANDTEAEPSSNEKLNDFELKLGKRNELWESGEKVAALEMNEEIYREISEAMESREINPLEAEPYNKDCREFREQKFEEAA